jgi:hypothetical protein
LLHYYLGMLLEVLLLNQENQSVICPLKDLIPEEKKIIFPSRIQILSRNPLYCGYLFLYLVYCWDLYFERKISS